MDSWKAWSVFFVSVSVMVVVLAILGIDEQIDEVLIVAFALGLVCALLEFLKRGREIRHRERLAMIEKGIFIEAASYGSGIPSLAVVLLVGIGLATVIASDVEFFGFALLFVGIGLILRARLLHNRNKEREALPPARPETAPAPAPAPETAPAPEPAPAAEKEAPAQPEDVPAADKKPAKDKDGV